MISSSWGNNAGMFVHGIEYVAFLWSVDNLLCFRSRWQEFNGDRNLPYLEKNVDSLGIVTPAHRRENLGHWRDPSRTIGLLHRPTLTFRASWQQLYWSLHKIFKLTIIYKKRHKNYINFRGNDSSFIHCCRTSSRSLISICLLLQLPCSKFKLSVGLWQKWTNANYWISTCFILTCYSLIISSKINRILMGFLMTLCEFEKLMKWPIWPLSRSSESHRWPM